LIYPVDLHAWLLVHSKRDTQTAQTFVKTFQQVAGPCGVNVRNPIYEVLSNDNPNAYVDAISENIDNKTQLVVCILPNDQKGRYDEIKKMCCVEKPIPSQCIIARNFNETYDVNSDKNHVPNQLQIRWGIMESFYSPL